ncbi:hypothetical protein HDU87_000303 [Geranomyces variabilis]|uniref:DUF5672 domain-containing protein n=1 Tax=Geranomyces variabilis TaxID=109894 RepID=A0AAD5XPA9_9FUNG|nr:hypothetical protein HDU87_000303 [Geranomyces variabilis]
MVYIEVSQDRPEPPLRRCVEIIQGGLSPRTRAARRRFVFGLFAVTLLVLTWTTLLHRRRRHTYKFGDELDPELPHFACPTGQGSVPALALNTSEVRTVGVFIEARPLPNIAAILLYFASYLGPSWPIHVFHSAENVNMLVSSGALAPYIEGGGIVLHALPPGYTAFESHDDVSDFLTTEWLWSSLLPATHALLFQADSVMCANSPLRPEHFLRYSFIGAPIVPRYGPGFNGGLSLRHIPTILRTLRTFEWADDVPRKPEDQWFASHIAKLDNPPPPLPLPTRDQARCFAVETIWADWPMGYHQAKRWNSARMDEILAWCPEVQLAESTGTFWEAKPVDRKRKPSARTLKAQARLAKAKKELEAGMAADSQNIRDKKRLSD